MNDNLLSFEAALQRLVSAAVAVTGTEIVATNDALGRVLAADVVSAINVPPMDNSAMDGYAVRVADLAIGPALEISQRIVAGQVGQALEPRTAARIMTGAPVPRGADAVVMQERCSVNGTAVLIDHSPRSGENIRRQGEDIAVGKTVLSLGTRIGAAELGVAASVGTATLSVYRRLRVALFSTGDELTMPGEPLKPGGIYNSNRATLYALLRGMGCSVTDFGIVPDKLDSTRAVLRAAAQDHDLILTSGGVSVGEEDHVKQAVAAEGELALWKLAIKPGKPLAFGRITSIHASAEGTDSFPLPLLPPREAESKVCRAVERERGRGGDDGAQGVTSPLSPTLSRQGRGGLIGDPNSPVGAGNTGRPTGRKCPEEGTPCAAFIGLPGNPVASFVTFLMLVRPYILKSQGADIPTPKLQSLRADFSWRGDKRREFLRVRRNDHGGLDLFPNQSSGVLTSCAWADGLVSNPPDCSIAVGDHVAFLPFSELV